MTPLRFRIRRDRWLPAVLVGVTTILGFGIGIVSLMSGWTTIFQNLLYIPIIIACVYYTKRGFICSVVIAGGYFVLMALFSQDAAILEGALLRVMIFILVAGVITYLSEIRNRAEEALRKNAKELHAAYEELTASQEELHANFDVLARQELALRESDEKIRLLLNSTAEAIYGLDMNGNCTFCNNSCLRLLGYKSQDELLGRNMHWQIHAKHADGTHFAIEECRITRAITKGEGTHADDEVLWRADGTSFPAEYWSYPLRRDGVVVGAVVTFVNITERKMAEDSLQRINRKLNVLSHLTREDLANRIFVLNSYLELTKKQLELAGQKTIIETLQKGVQEIRFIHETIEFAKDFQDMGAKPPIWQNVKTTMLLGVSHISMGKIQQNIETENLEIFADPLLEKVFQRLFENSAKHGDHVTQIRIRHTITPDGVVIFFEDDGIGIPLEKKEQIFLRSEGSRVSVRSLVFVREILDITGITITETGEPGKGARFEIAVPKGAYRITTGVA